MIEINGLQKIVNGRLEVGIASLTVKAGEIVAIIGQTHSGKQTLLHLLTGRSLPTAGTVRLNGLDPYHEREQVGQILGILFAENALYARMTVRANLIFHCQMRGLSEIRADQILAQVGLSDHANVPVRHIPPGLARRLAFGRAILHSPQILILDNPLAGCDTSTYILLSQLIRHLAEANTAILILANEASGLASLCQTIYEADQASLQRIELPQTNERNELPFKIPARLDGQVALVNPAEILYISAKRGRGCLHTLEGSLPTQFTLAEIEARLSHQGFFRAHRSYLVNLQHVKAIVPYTRDSFSLILNDTAKTEIPLSKNSAQELRELLDY